MGVVVQLAHRKRRGCLLPDDAEVVVVLRREQVLQEEELELLDVLGKADTLYGRDALVDVVQQLHVPPDGRPQMLEQRHRGANVRHGLEYAGRVFRQGPWPRPALGPVGRHTRPLPRPDYAFAACAIGLEPGRGHLHPDVVVPVLCKGSDAVLNLPVLGAAGVDVDGRRVPRLPSPQVVYRHAGHLALDVPQRLVDAAQRVVQHGTVAPVRRHIAGLPDVLDVPGVLPDGERPQVVVHRRQHCSGTLGERCAAHPVKLRLRRLDLHDHQTYAVRLGQNHPHVPDERVSHA